MGESRFIVFEGIDGSGTTTQAALLAERLEAHGVDVVRTREPGGTPLGESLRRLLLDPASHMADTAEALLYAASRAQHVAEVIRPAIHRGATVVSDRFVDSSLAYQGSGRGLGVELVRSINAPAVADCLPDLTVYLDLPVAAARRRRQARGAPADRVEAAGDSLQERVAEAYRRLARGRGYAALVVDGTLHRERIRARVWECVCSHWPALGAAPPRAGT